MTRGAQENRGIKGSMLITYLAKKLLKEKKSILNCPNDFDGFGSDTQQEKRREITNADWKLDRACSPIFFLHARLQNKDWLEKINSSSKMINNLRETESEIWSKGIRRIARQHRQHRQLAIAPPASSCSGNHYSKIIQCRFQPDKTFISLALSSARYEMWRERMKGKVVIKPEIARGENK